MFDACSHSHYPAMWQSLVSRWYTHNIHAGFVYIPYHVFDSLNCIVLCCQGLLDAYDHSVTNVPFGESGTNMAEVYVRTFLYVRETVWCTGVSFRVGSVCSGNRIFGISSQKITLYWLVDPTLLSRDTTAQHCERWLSKHLAYHDFSGKGFIVQFAAALEQPNWNVHHVFVVNSQIVNQVIGLAKETVQSHPQVHVSNLKMQMQR